MSQSMLVLACALLVISVPLASATRHTLSGARRLTTCSSGCSNITGSAAGFGAIAYSTITNVGFTVVAGGDMALYPGSSITGFPPGKCIGNTYVDQAPAVAAQSDAQIGFDSLVSMPFVANLTGQDLGNMTLTAGKYIFAELAQLTGNLTFDAEGDSTALFVLQTGTKFTTAVAANILLLNGAQACNVFYAIGSSAVIGAASVIQGTIMAYQSITLGHATSVQGSVIALGAAITFDDNAVTALGAC